MAAASNTRCIPMQELEQQEDRLSKLPDDILLCVLDRLHVRDAVRSGILSRRWRHLPHATRRITLDVKRHKLKDEDGSRSALPEEARANMAVAEAARRLLARRGQQQAVRVLYLRFYLTDESTMDIVRAVDDAMTRGCGIARATFAMLGDKIDFLCTDEDLARNARCFLSCFHACPTAFAGLTKLHMESVKLGQSDMSNVLATCSRLKSLSLLNCDSGRDTALAVQHPWIAVLKLVSCGTVELKWLPKLVELTCESWLPSSQDPLLFGHVPRLRTIVLATKCTSEYKILKLSELLDSNASIRELWMDFVAERLWIQPEGPKQLAPRLSNLKILNLEYIPEECGITWTFFLLEAAPLLEELHIQVSNHQCIPIEDEMLKEGLICKKTFVEWETSGFKRYNLAVLSIYGFQPEKIFMGYITRIMEVAVNLEEISLYDEFCPHCGFCPSTRYPQTKIERDLIRKEINQGRSSPINTILFYARPRSARGEPIEIID